MKTLFISSIVCFLALNCTHIVSTADHYEASSLLKYTTGICCIFQDSKGNYWFGSHSEGVCKYDGKNYTYYTMADGLANNNVREIAEDQQGVIWFGTGNGVSSFDGNKMTNHQSLYPTTLFQSLPEAKWQLDSNDLWFNADSQPGLYRVSNGQVSFLKLPSIERDSAFFGVTGISKHPGQLWIATYPGVIGYDGEEFSFITLSTLRKIQAKGYIHVRSILEDSKGRLWIGNNGVGVLLQEQDSLINFSEQQGLIHPESKLSGSPSPEGTLEHVFAITEDSNGNIWFGDRDNGAWKYDGKTMTNYTIDSSLSSPMIWTIYQDQQGDLLFGMAYGGVYHLDGKKFTRKY